MLDDVVTHRIAFQRYEHGTGVAQDSVEAIKWYKIAAAQGCGSAECTLGSMHVLGTHGLEKDYVEAVRLFRLAAEKGDSLPQNNLGSMYG